MARAGDLEITVDVLPKGGSVVHVDGELDLATKQQLEEAVGEAEPSERLVIDLTDCTFLDSSAVRVLISTARSVQEAGGHVAVVASDAGVRRVLEIAAVDSVLPVHATLDRAL